MRLLLIAVLFALFLVPVSASDGSEHLWIQKHHNAQGWGCCGPFDTAKVSHSEANSAQIGSQLIVKFPTGPEIVTVNAIYPTQDPKGIAYITRYGCLFRWSGG